ncbi:MAG: winged helix-turn-helix domain-containing protein [Chloroflexi bacterium]|nr:winged helix-turn-helix domain-containing protein [Chloroflexota bacterium]MBV9546245.1 winged helix-turn-helix domain-containing protein [Chloroflexota bacterium]
MAQLPACAQVARSEGPLPAVRAFCLGDFRLLVDGRALENCGTGKAGALLQYLVNHANRALPREQLIETLWPNPDADAAGTSLRVAVHALRQLISGESKSNSLGVYAHAAGYQLTARRLWLDVDEFADLCTRGRHLLTAGHLSEAVNAYSRAVELYRGDFLEGATDSWAVVRREGLKDQFLFALERLAEAALQAGAYEECLSFAQRLVEQDHCRESGYRILMTCHAECGQRGRVRSWYELCVQTLRAELGVEPEEATTGLYYSLMGKSSPDGNESSPN